jgi:hypothetical protein
LDTSKIFVYGHSIGGATSALVALNDGRVLGGLDLDGLLFWPASRANLDKPFFIMGSESTMNATSYYGGFMDKIDGAKMLLAINGTQHYSYFDLPLLLSLRDDIPSDLEPVITTVLGTINGKRLAVVVNNVLGMMTSFLFKGKAEPLCKVEHKIAEAIVLERDLKRACCD